MKKDVRADNTYIISKESTDNPKLGAKILSDGRESLFLDYYFGYSTVYDEGKGKNVTKINRKREYLKLYLRQTPKTPIERQHNKETIQLANNIRYEKAQQLLNDERGYRLSKKGKTNILNYFQNIVDNYPERDLIIRNALKDFRKFLSEEYPIYENKLEGKNLTPEMIKRFTLWLEDNHKGTGANTYYQRFKTIINKTVNDGEMIKNPCRGITIANRTDILTKDILSMEEIKTLFATHYEQQNPDVRRAFAFTCLTGIRYCDIVCLKYSNIDYSNKILTFRQSKTQRHSSASGVTIPLNDTLLEIIGNKAQDANDDFIFHLPTFKVCTRSLSTWTNKAGINKHITWHCGRHSFATNLLNNGANIKVVSSLLGHTTLKHTEKYVRAVDKLKQDAINSLATLKI